MATGQSKIELILDLKNRIGTGLVQAKKQINTDVGQMQNRLDEFSSSGKKGFKNVVSDLPAVKSGFMSNLINPLSLAATAAGAVAVGLMKATDRAADFNHEFRDLANLNLDKPQKEIDDLRRMVLDSAYKKGFNAEKTSNAYNELQSTAGIYGADARPIVEKQGEFALLMKTSMDDYVAGTAKAMANWRFGIDKLDSYNKSNYAAMQVGVVSFEELAKVQSTFAGSAASINQSFDTANKLFSIFTVKTKSVDEAATLTKSLFNDLTKASTIKAFKDVGINVFETNGRLKQADNIMIELNDKFLKMGNDKAVVNLKNQFKGSEGLIAMIQAATDKTGELRNLLNEFQDSKFNADMALSHAHNDIIYRQEKLSNRIDNLMIRLGQTLLPAKEWLVGAAESVVKNIGTYVSGVDDYNASQKRQDSYNAVLNRNEYLLDRAQTMSDKEFNNIISYFERSGSRNMADAERLADKYKKMGLFEAPEVYFWGNDAKVKFGDEKDKYARSSSLGTSEGYYELIQKLRGARSNSPSDDTTTNQKSGSSGGDLSGISDTLNRVVGSAQAPRNITVNIEAFNKGGINTQNTSLQKMDAQQIDDWFTDMCYRAIRNIELSYE